MEETKLMLDELPYDVLLSIFKRLDFKDLIQMSQVNKRLNDLTNDQYLWKEKLLQDMHNWRMIDSKSWPKQLQFKQEKILLDELALAEICYKKCYLNCCPDVSTRKDILKKLKSFQQIQNTLHATSTSENLTLSSLSSFAMPMMVFGQLKDFVFRTMFRSEQPQHDNTAECIPKLVLFGPGLETSTSCLVTNILWKSEFKTVGMIPGKDGYGAGIKLKLFNHRPFNLTILYTNNSQMRSKNSSHNLNENRLLLDKSSDEVSSFYELNPRVREACADAHGFVYVIDNNSLSMEFDKIGDNYRTELSILMREVDRKMPLLILSLNTNDLTQQGSANKQRLSCVNIIELLELNRLEQEWQIRNCEIFQPKMKDIILGFEWILNELDQNNYLSQQQDQVNNV